MSNYIHELWRLCDGLGGGEGDETARIQNWAFSHYLELQLALT